MVKFYGLSNYPQGNQAMAFSSNAGNIIPPEHIYRGGLYAGNQFANIYHLPPNSNLGNIENSTALFGQNIHQVPSQLVTGMDPRYLANYSDNSAHFIVTGEMMQTDTGNICNGPHLGFSGDFKLGSNYQNRSFIGAVNNKKNTPHVINPNVIRHPENTRNFVSLEGKMNTQPQSKGVQGDFQKSPFKETSKVVTSNAPKEEPQVQIVSRTEKLQSLHKSGPRAFSGPVEKVLKWHKALQDIGLFIFYEIVAKCVNIRNGESCSKILVIRDENGPAMQVVYYEIDFLLPELKIPSTIRVIGRMVAGTCRLQAFSVRPATGDDVAMLSRRAAVAAHHVAKLCKEYGIHA